MRTVHKVCTMLKNWEAADRGSCDPDPCLKCPAREPIKHYGKAKSMCRAKAEEFVNIVTTGNPWGRKKCKWPQPHPKRGGE